MLLKYDAFGFKANSEKTKALTGGKPTVVFELLKKKESWPA
jgi:hypothetical protein